MCKNTSRELISTTQQETGQWIAERRAARQRVADMCDGCTISESHVYDIICASDAAVVAHEDTAAPGGRFACIVALRHTAAPQCRRPISSGRDTLHHTLARFPPRTGVQSSTLVFSRLTLLGAG